MPGTSRIVWNTAALESLVNGPMGGTARFLERKAVEIENIAKQNASVADGVPPERRTGGPGLRRVTGAGVGSIAHEVSVDGHGLYARIGTNLFYMAIQELQGEYVWLLPALEAVGE